MTSSQTVAAVYPYILSTSKHHDIMISRFTLHETAMPLNEVPQGAPPPYEETSSAPQRTNHLVVPRNGIPHSARRSMEDENRDLPSGWVRQYDAQTHHQFFVDTTSNPPRSNWHHPYDDDRYLSSLSDSERTRIKELHRVPSQADIEAESSDDDDLPPRQGQREGELSGAHKLGRKMKDKLTSSTHTEREARRRQREEQERRLYAQHQRFRQAMSRAAQTGEPQFIGKDKDGKDVYIEPPSFGGGGMGGGFNEGIGGYPGGRYANGGYGYNPFLQGPYGMPSARYARPMGPYQRPNQYGYGYGGGLGMPLIGGLMLGGLMF